MPHHWTRADTDRGVNTHTTLKVEEPHCFRDVPERIAVAEGEGDLSLDYWRKSHAAHYSPHLEEWGIVDLEGATVVTEHFTLVFRREPPHG